MRCRSCGHENPESGRFCEGCGQELLHTCPACGAELNSEARFCGQCGAAIAESAPAPPGLVHASDAERRQLTVLFCDLVDSTRLAAGMDPEDWREVVRRYQEVAAREVERVGGHVAQYLGDGILAYFGWPRAHEDDGERGVRAGLALAAVVEAPLRVRVGIHTGPVVVGEMGGGEKRETLALGDTTNVAARLQGLADPGTVVLSDATLRLVAGIFVTRELGPRALKGLDEPLRVHQAIRPSGVRSRLDIAAATGLTPLVGRDQELGLLDDRFAQVREGRGHAVLIQGEAGIGKSRLVATFRERIAERGHTWLECRGSPYTQDSALFPVLELLRQGLLFSPGDPPALQLERIEIGLTGVGFDLARTLPLLAALYGIPLSERYEAPNLSPEALRKRTLGLLAEWLLRLGREQPVVLLMEDLHWMDPSTVELLGTVLEQIPTVQVLLLATYRPDFEQPWGMRSHLTPMLLARLTRAQLGDLVRKAARGREIPDAWVEEITRRSDGVPLFAEELTRAVLETSLSTPEAGEASTLPIPETLQDSLMARLDALGPVKELAQLGAVLGREFDYRLLLAVSPMKEADLQPALVAAVREELFYQRGTPPEATYLFKHALIRDAAYQSMLRSTRQRHHRRVAETLIERMPEVVEAQPELVAHHLAEAGDAERAIEWWRRAGDRSLQRSANQEAVRHFESGMALIAKLPQGRERDQVELALQSELGSALWVINGWATEENERTLRRSLELATRLAHDASRRSAVYGLASMHLTRSELAESLRLMLELRDLAVAGDDLEGELAAWSGIIASPLLLGQLDRAALAFDGFLERDALLEVDRSWIRYGASQRVQPRAWAGWALWLHGDRQRASAVSAEAISLARATGHPISLCFALALRAVMLAGGGQAREVDLVCEELVPLAQDQDAPVWIGLGQLLRSWARASLEPGDDTLASESQAAIALAGSTRNLAGAPFFMCCHADTLRLSGQLAEALQLIGGALAFSAQLKQGLYDAELRRLKGDLLLALGGHPEQEAEAEYRRALEIARAQSARSLELRAAHSLARLWRRQRKRAEARDLLAPVYAWFTEGFDTKDLIDAKALLAELA